MCAAAALCGDGSREVMVMVLMMMLMMMMVMIRMIMKMNLGLCDVLSGDDEASRGGVIRR